MPSFLFYMLEISCEEHWCVTYTLWRANEVLKLFEAGNYKVRSLDIIITMSEAGMSCFKGTVRDIIRPRS